MAELSQASVLRPDSLRMTAYLEKINIGLCRGILLALADMKILGFLFSVREQAIGSTSRFEVVNHVPRTDFAGLRSKKNAGYEIEECSSHVLHRCYIW